MPKHTYCLQCGQELDRVLVALKNKQLIVETIKPHTCDESGKYLDNVTDKHKPSSPIEEMVEKERITIPSDDDLYTDQRPESSKRSSKLLTSSAPKGLLDLVKKG